MPRLNSRGQSACGLGGGTVSIDNLPIASPAGGASWLTDDVIIYQVCRDGRCWLETFDQRNGEFKEAHGSGANNIAAGGGVWAAWRDGYGLFTSHGDRHPEAGAAEVGPDGAIAYKPVHQSFGPVILSPRNGPERVLTQTAPLTLQLLGGDMAIWGNADFSVGTSGLPTPHTLPTAAGLWRPRAALVNGEWWIAYVHGGAGGLVLHPFTSTVGYMVHRGPNAFGHDLLALNGGILVVYSWNEGEQPGELRREPIDLSTPRVELASPIVIPDPQPDPEPEPAMQIPVAAWDVIKAMHARFSGDFPATEDGGRGFTEKTIQQLKFSFPSGGWCWKRADANRPPSKDCTARQIDGRFEGWDILSAAGASGPRVLANFPPTYHDLIAEGNQVPIPVEAVNHLGTSVPDPEPDPLKPHIYDGGENDTGTCDRAGCGRPRADAIHIQAEPDQPPPSGDFGAVLARIEAKVDRLTKHLGGA